jgi:hypothetical protein
VKETLSKLVGWAHNYDDTSSSVVDAGGQSPNPHALFYSVSQVRRQVFL